MQNAFLHGRLAKEVYMKKPPSFVDPLLQNHVCRLHKSLYELKQAPRAWYHHLSTFLLTISFVGSVSNNSFFLKKNGEFTVYILTYIDDIIIIGFNFMLIQEVINHLKSRFAIKDLGPLHYFLGVEAIHHQHGLFLSQQQYIVELLQKSKMDGAKQKKTQICYLNKLSKSSGSAFNDSTLY